MTQIKLCGLSRLCDIEVANELKPEYIGFVFAPKSKRYVTPEKVMKLKRLLIPDIKTVGVFVDEEAKTVAKFLNCGIIDIAQLHGDETEGYIKTLKRLTDKPIIKAFRIDTEQDTFAAQNSGADHVLLDSGRGGTGTVFDWNLIRHITRPYFLAGGLGIGNVEQAVKKFNPYALDVSSGIETEGLKDKTKMTEFVRTVRGALGKEETE